VISAGAAVAVGLVSLGLVVTPGPNMMYLVARSLGQGRRAGMTSLAGVVAAFACYLGLTAAGLSVVFATVPALYLVVKVLGAAYLAWLAWGVLRGRRSVLSSHDVAPDSPRRLVAMGFLTCILNPKIALMYAALLPQFVDTERGSTGQQIVLLGLVQIVVATTVNAGWVLLAGRIRSTLQQRPAAERATRYVVGLLLGGFAVHLAASTS